MAALYQCDESEGWFGTKNEGGKMKTTEVGSLRLKPNDASTFVLGTIQENISEGCRVQ